MIREPDAHPEVDTFDLGHWEVMQISGALWDAADLLGDTDAGRHTRALSHIFSGDAVFTVTRKRVVE